MAEALHTNWKVFLRSIFQLPQYIWREISQNDVEDMMKATYIMHPNCHISDSKVGWKYSPPKNAFAASGGQKERLNASPSKRYKSSMKRLVE
jgi:hypothetical protein